MRRELVLFGLMSFALFALESSGSFAASGAAQKRSVISALERQIVKKAEEAVRAKLRDPASARFRGGKLYRHQAVCGLVSAKNAYDGYADEVVYLHIIESRQSFILEDGGQNYTEKDRLVALFEKYCRP
ncbi:hypothetical protein [Pseudolabrys sp. Root1462]|uniref:hypothetical protein n=1 Tax=Pseudolabrys sp. Root1462 TaxID=1736466 RepID=UPI0012E33C53|nr:hypothetical protein [Pseudolabrys sp. Root1462]